MSVILRKRQSTTTPMRSCMRPQQDQLYRRSLLSQLVVSQSISLVQIHNHRVHYRLPWHISRSNDQTCFELLTASMGVEGVDLPKISDLSEHATYELCWWTSSRRASCDCTLLSFLISYGYPVSSLMICTNISFFTFASYLYIDCGSVLSICMTVHTEYSVILFRLVSRLLIVLYTVNDT